MKFSIKDFFSKCDEIRSFLRDWSHLLKKSLKKIKFCAVNLLEKRLKHVEDGITLLLTFHRTGHIVFDVLNKAHQHVQKSPLPKAVLPKRPRVPLYNPIQRNYLKN